MFLGSGIRHKGDAKTGRILASPIGTGQIQRDMVKNEPFRHHFSIHNCSFRIRSITAQTGILSLLEPDYVAALHTPGKINFTGMSELSYPTIGKPINPL